MGSSPPWPFDFNAPRNATEAILEVMRREPASKIWTTKMIAEIGVANRSTVEYICSKLVRARILDKGVAPTPISGGRMGWKRTTAYRLAVKPEAPPCCSRSGGKAKPRRATRRKTRRRGSL